MNAQGSADSSHLPMEAREGLDTLCWIIPGKQLDHQTGIHSSCCNECLYQYQYPYLSQRVEATFIPSLNKSGKGGAWT